MQRKEEGCLSFNPKSRAALPHFSDQIFSDTDSVKQIQIAVNYNMCHLENSFTITIFRYTRIPKQNSERLYGSHRGLMNIFCQNTNEV